MTEANRWWRVAIQVFALACVAVGVTALSGPTAEAVVTVKVATGNAVRGGPLVLTLSMARESGEESVATLQTDVIFNTAQLDLVGACGTGGACRLSSDCPEGDACQYAPVACEKDPRLGQHRVDALPPDFQNVQPGQRRVRFAVLATQLPVPTFTDGAVLTCTFQVQPNAPVGRIELAADRLQVADNSIPARPIPSSAVIESGSITDGPLPTATATGTVDISPTPTGGSPTPDGGSPSPTPSVPVPTSTPGERTPCPSPRSAPSGPALFVEDLNLAMSGQAAVTVRLATGGAEIAGTQNDLGFDANVFINRRANGRPDCTVNGDIDKSGTSFAFRPPGCAEGECTGIRGLVLSTENTDPIPDGSVLYTCNVTVHGEGGVLGVSGVIMSGPTGQRIDGVSGREGGICVEPPPAPTATPPPTATGGAQGSATPTQSRTPDQPAPTHTTGPSTQTPTRSATPGVTATVTQAGGGGGGNGDGCDCNIGSNGDRRGVSSAWLGLPAVLLLWRRRRR